MTLMRARHKMQDYIRLALVERGPMDVYQARPKYQQNDYLGWIIRAKREDPREKRLAHTCPGCRCRGMLEELAGGERYMKMKWRSK